ncbi:MAG: flagellar protein FlgN [Rhodocyclales bacterium]|nr:flagellar protein FlgN [Rhodocyclales bacterium]
MATIESRLQASHSALGEFLVVIEAERQTLAQGDVDALQAITAQKSALAARLAELDTQLDAALTAQNHPAGRPGVERWLGTLPAAGSQASRTTWTSILDLATKAKQANEINGRLIAARLQQNQQALDVLLNEGAESTTYGADGQRNSSAGRRTLGSA